MHRKKWLETQSINKPIFDQYYLSFASLYEQYFMIPKKKILNYLTFFAKSRDSRSNGDEKC